MLTRDQQRFLPHYTNAAAVLDSDEGIERAVAGRFASDVAYQTTKKGITYRWDEDPGDMLTMTGLITWPQLRAHREAQPQAARDQLRRAVDADRAEHQHHWTTWHQISPNGHWNADADVRARLDTEWERHITASRRTRADLDAAVLAMLPLVTDLEPADLIEYADTLNQQDA